MMKRARVKTFAWVIAVLLGAAWGLPLVVRVNFWKTEIAAALSHQLHRPVAIGDIHLQIIGGLGVNVDNVNIAEDPAFGNEPFARIDSMEASLAASSIWRGRIEFSRLVLSGASFNIVRNTAGNWNLASIGGEAANLSAVPDAPVAVVPPEDPGAPLLPSIRIDSGRIDFKSEDRKRAWCLQAVSLELSPPRSPRRPWRFEFSALPTRTDIPFHATNPLRAQGEFGPFSSDMQKETGVPLRADWSAENALLVEWLTIAAGRDLGVHGTVNVRGHIAGTTSLLRVSAESEIKDLHRWDLFPNSAAPSLKAQVKGIVDLSAGTLELSSISVPLGSGALAGRGRAEELFTQPHVSLDVEMRRVPLDSLAELAPQFTAHLDRTASAEGTLSGELHVEGAQPVELFTPVSLPGASALPGIEGTIQVSAGAFRPSKSAPQLHFTAFDLLLGGSNVRFGALRITPDQSGPLQISGDWDTSKQTSHWRLAGDRIALSAVARVFNGLGITWSSAEFSEGTAAIKLDIIAGPGAPPRLTGSGQILGGVINVRGVAEPLRIPSAKLLFGPADVKLQPISIEFGSMDFGGNLTIKLPETHPVSSSYALAPFSVHDLSAEFHLDSPLLDLQQLAALFGAPPPSASFFSFASSGPTAPVLGSAVDQKIVEIVDSMPVTGTLQAERFRYHGIAMENLKASVRYEDRRLEVSEFSAEHSGGIERGAAAVSFGRAPLSFNLESRFSNIEMGGLVENLDPWKGLVSGRLSGSLKLESSGRSLDEIISRLTGSIEAAGRDVVIRGSQWTEALGEGVSETRIGSFSSTAEIGGQQIHIAEMKLIPARRHRAEAARELRPEAWSVSGDVGFDRSLHLIVQQDPEGAESRWAGTLEEPRASGSISRVTSEAVSQRSGASHPAR